MNTTSSEVPYIPEEKTLFLKDIENNESEVKNNEIDLLSQDKDKDHDNDNDNDKKIPIDILIQVGKLNKEKEIKKSSNRKIGWRQYTGLILALFSSFFFSLVLVFVKVLHVYHPFSLSVWRQLGNVIPSIPMVLYFRYWRKQPVFAYVWPIHTKENRSNVIGMAIRGFLGANGVLLRFYALNYLTIADATVIQYSGPIFIVIMGHFFLKEKCGVTSIVIGIWMLFGVILISRPPFLTGKDVDINILIGTGIVLSAVLCQGTVTILVRKIRKIHFAVMMLVFGVWGFFQSLIVAMCFGVMSVPVGWTDIGYTVLLALLSFMGQLCAIMSLKFEQAGLASLIRTSDVLFAFIWQIIFLNVLPDIFSILGAIIVMIGVLMTAAKKWVSTLPEENKKRKIFKFLLK